MVSTLLLHPALPPALFFGLRQVIDFSVPRSGGAVAGHEVRGTNKLAGQKLRNPSAARDVVALNSRPPQKTYSSGSITVSALGL